MAVLGTNQFPLFGLRFVCWFYGGNTQRLTESGIMEKSGIEHATPGLQGIVLFLTPGGFDPWDSKKTFCGFPRYKPVLLCLFKICVLVLCWEHPNAHRKWFYGEAGNRTCDPLFNKA